MQRPGGLASKSAFIFGTRLTGAGLIFIVQAAIARIWGAELLGDYMLVVATANLLAVAMPLGFQTVGTYFAAKYRAQGEGAHLWRFMARAYGHVFVVGGLIVLFGVSVTDYMGEAGAHLRPLWTPAALLALGSAIIFVNGAILVGLKRPVAGFVADSIFRPLLVIAAFAIIVVLAEGPDLLAMLWVLALSYLVLAAVHFGFVVATARTLPAQETVRPREARRWWRFAMPWVLITLASDFFFDINLLLLAGALSREDLAIFGVCTRIFSLISFSVSAVYAISLPDMFAANAETFDRRVGDANVVATGLALLLFGIVALSAPLALGLFGESFIAGAAPLAVLCLSLVVRAVFGPATLVLSIHDRPYASLPAVGLGLATLIGGNAALVPAMGLMGASLSALIAISVWSAGLWLTALIKAGVDVSLLSRLRQIAARA